MPTIAEIRGDLGFRLGRVFGRRRREDILDPLPRDSVGAEIGVFRGEFSRRILQVVRPRRLHLIDTWWERYGERFPNWGEYTRFGRLGTREAYDETVSRVRPYLERGVAQIHVGSDLEILEGFEDGYFDWVYLDASHGYKDTKAELEILGRKVKRDGWILGDDWLDPPQPGAPGLAGWKNSRWKNDPDGWVHGVRRAVTELLEDPGWELVCRDEFHQWCVRRTGAR